MAPPKSMPKRKAVAEPSNRETRKAKTAVKVKVEVTYVSKGLSPQIPQTDSRKKRLRNNLKVMGCNNLLTLPWGYTSNTMLEEIRNRTGPGEFQGLVRASPAQWTKDVIAEAFQVEAAGEGIPAKVAPETYREYFFGSPSASDGWKYSDCREEELRDV
jgi:hypothetical protein